MKILKEKEYLAWWNNLSQEWKQIFKSKIRVTTSGVNLQDVKSLFEIKKLEAGGTQIKSLEPIKDFVNLKHLDITLADITDLSPVSSLMNLEKLYCIQTGIKDLTPLGNLNKLKHLDISFNEIYDVSPLKNLHNLNRLNIYATGITDTTSLKNIKNLSIIT